MTLHFYWTCLDSEETKLLICTVIFFVWCLQRQRNGGLNSGQKSANIVTDALKCEQSYIIS